MAIRNMDKITFDGDQIKFPIREIIQETLAGEASNRPFAPFNGMMFFDVTLGKPIWFNGTTWVDCEGLPV